MTSDEDHTGMSAALRHAAKAPRRSTSPNPSVGCFLRAVDGSVVGGWTHPPGGPHAEAHALAQAEAQGISTVGSTVYVTLEPCSHQGRTPPCADALIAAGVSRVVVGLLDPDIKVAGAGVARLVDAGVQVDLAAEVGLERFTWGIATQLEEYLHHRRFERPFVTLKMAASLDGRTAAPDGSSRWITGPEARADVHRLRAAHDAILVGAGTVRADDPELTVRDAAGLDPRRYVLGAAPAAARIHPCTEVAGPLADVLDAMGRDGVVNLLVEGGATVANAFHDAGLVDRYVLYLAPVLFGGDDGRPLFAGNGAATIAVVWRGRIERIEALGDDVRIDLVPNSATRSNSEGTS